MYKQVYKNWISKQQEIEERSKNIIIAKAAIDENVVEIKNYTDEQKRKMNSQLRKIGVKV